jgi:hypothetical protein
MTTIELNLNLPDDLAQRARSAGLLTSEAIESMLCHELSKRAGENHLSAMWTHMPRQELTPEIERDIAEAVRAERAARRRQRDGKCG